jgi:hypothetical protein
VHLVSKADKVFKVRKDHKVLLVLLVGKVL